MTDPFDPATGCWFLAGATASGKTKISLELAKLLDAEIVSMDSMAIYRGMDVGTAKPSPKDRDTIPHHMIDIRDPNEMFSTSQYRESALALIEEIRSRNKTVLFVGGTALYLKAILRGLFDGPPADWEFRKEIETEIADMGEAFLHERLQMIDPVSAHNLHPNDQRRIIRALEVFKQTGKPISHWQLQFDQGRPASECKVFAIRHERSILHTRIESRVTQMFENGLVEEVRNILGEFNELSRTATQAVGYREAIEHLEGNLELDEAIERVRIRTRRFARHQETWFRNLTECRMVDLNESFDATETANHLFELGNESVAKVD
jgi:tRNA dimethylallyltransferase